MVNVRLNLHVLLDMTLNCDSFTTNNCLIGGTSSKIMLKLRPEYGGMDG